MAIYVLIGIVLADRIGWPEAYGFECSGRRCLFIQMWHSGQLLSRWSFGELIVFAWIWAPVIAVVAAIGLAQLSYVRRVRALKRK